MNSTITDILKNNDSIFLAVELKLAGRSYYFAPKNIRFADKVFDGSLLTDVSVASKFDLNNIKYSTKTVGVVIANNESWQNKERYEDFDSATGKVYMCAEGLTWDQISENLLLFSGSFKKASHNKYKYAFQIIDDSRYKFDSLPTSVIDDTTWPTHRKVAGSGSVSGKDVPFVFGDWRKGIPALCVDTALFHYIIMAGVSISTDAEYTATTENLYNKAGAALDQGSYPFTMIYSVDGLGNVVTLIDSDQAFTGSEPLSVSVRGVQNASGLVEHPADIIQYLADNHSSVTFDEPSVRDMKSSLPSYKMSMYINKKTTGIKILNRILSQCLAGRVTKLNGKTGLMVFDPNIEPTSKIDLDVEALGDSITFTRTPESMLVNDLAIKYGYNPLTSSYEKTLIFNWTNNQDASDSYSEYGAMPQKELNLPDIQLESVATAIGHRYLQIYAKRHDIITNNIQAYIGANVNEGEASSITTELGSNGWADEKCILLDRKFKGSVVTQRWWRVST